jgi:hypothetical protein
MRGHEEYLHRLLHRRQESHEEEDQEEFHMMDISARLRKSKVTATILSFKCVLRYSAQKIRYFFNGYIFKTQTVYMDENSRLKTRPKSDK